jgi:hypothetical protein
MLLKAVLRVAKKEQWKCPLRDEWVNSMAYQHNGGLFGHKKNEVLIHVTWMNLGNTEPGVRSQTQKVIYSMITFISYV